MTSQELKDRVLKGVEYCNKVYDPHRNKCTRIGKKYDCDNCKVPPEEEKEICRAWRKVQELARLYHITQALELINSHFVEKNIDKLPDWAKDQGKAKIIPTSQMDLFKK